MTKWLLVILVLLLAGCQPDKAGRPTRIILYPQLDRNRVLYLERMPFGEEHKVKLDSVVRTSIRDSIVFTIPPGGERIYHIRVPRSRMMITLINDVPEITVRADYFNETYTIEGSPASASIKKFNDQRAELAAATNQLYRQIENLKRLNPQDERIKGLEDELSGKVANYKSLVLAVADTISSPAGFMQVSNLIEFGEDYEGLKKFMTRASTRFPTYQPIQELVKEMLDMINIYEEEFVVGDQLPSVILPDKLGLPVPTDSRRGKVVLIDFWATWCPECLHFNLAKKAAREAYPKEKFEIISVALDSEKEDWLRLIETEKYDWLQLIDERMWRGVTAKTLKFDSIPFNFLLSPEGKIVDKAIKPDSLLNSIARALNQPPKK